MSSAGGVSASEEDCHIILLEMMALHHVKPLIGCRDILGRADNCTISVYINKQGSILSTVLLKPAENFDIRP